MILKTLSDILNSDASLIFEDISLLENMSKYSNIIKVENKDIIVYNASKERKFNILKEKTKDLNVFLNKVFLKDSKGFEIINNRIKIVNNTIYLNFISKNKNNKNDKINLIINHNGIDLNGFIQEKFGKLVNIKFTKSNNKVFLYIFLEGGFMKINLNELKIYLN